VLDLLARLDLQALKVETPNGAKAAGAGHDDSARLSDRRHGNPKHPHNRLRVSKPTLVYTEFVDKR